MTTAQDYARVTDEEWERWILVANNACAEVGAVGWRRNREGQPMTSVATEYQYRSAMIAHLALRFDERKFPGMPAGEVICWGCWKANMASSCAGIPIRGMLGLPSCGNWP